MHQISSGTSSGPCDAGMVLTSQQVCGPLKGRAARPGACESWSSVELAVEQNESLVSGLFGF